MEAFTGVSSGAIGVGGKIVAGSVIYAGGEISSGQIIANIVFSSWSLLINVIDFLLVPAGYLYKLVKKQKLPINLDNNSKWLMAGVTLLLSIISAAVQAAATVISFVSAGLGIVFSILTVIKAHYLIKLKADELVDINCKITQLADKIKMDMQTINHLQD